MKHLIRSICILVFLPSIPACHQGEGPDTSPGFYEGHLQTLIYDYDDGSHATKHYLLTDEGERFELANFPGADQERRQRLSLGLRAGSTIRPLQTDEPVRIEATSLDEKTLHIHEVESKLGPTLTQDAAFAPKSRSVPVFMVLTWGSGGDKAMDTSKRVMQEVRDSFIKASYGERDLNIDGDADGTPDVVGPISVSGGGCQSDSWARAADQVAQREHNVDFSKYSHRVYVFSSRQGCGWSGLAALSCVIPGSSRCRAWLNTLSGGVFFHELGHNLGMGHASKGGSEYGDNSDPMGSASYIHFNAAHTDQMGWFDPFKSAIRKPLRRKETVNLYPMGVNPEDGNTRTVKYSQGSTTWYLSYRNREGLDRNLRDRSYVDRVSVHSLSRSKTNIVKVLGDGDSWTSPDGKFKATVAPGEDSGYKVLQLAYADGADSEAIRITTQPASKTVAAGSEVTLSVESTGKDLKWQWFHNDQTIRGATEQTLVLDAVQADQTGRYRVEISDALETVVSDDAIIRTEDQPELEIIESPADRTISTGGQVNLTVTARGSGDLTYQWYKDDKPLRNTDHPTLTIDGVDEDDSGTYHVTVSDMIDSIDSDPARLQVTPEGKFTTISVDVSAPDRDEDSGDISRDLVLGFGNLEQGRCRLPETGEKTCTFDVETSRLPGEARLWVE